VWLVGSNDHESYVAINVATGRVTLVGQIKGADPDRKGCPGPRCRGLGVGLRTPACKTWIYFETSN